MIAVYIQIIAFSKEKGLRCWNIIRASLNQVDMTTMAMVLQ